MNSISAATANRPNGRRSRAASRGARREVISAALIGSASSSTRLMTRSRGSTAIARAQASVRGLAAIIRLKFSGVNTSASTFDTAEMESDNARLPRPK